MSQRHEKVGTTRAYQNFEAKQVPINIHTHDRNGSVNKMANEHPYIVNQNDVWHAVKSSKKKVVDISKGPLYKHGKTWQWHRELEDKSEAMGTYLGPWTMSPLWCIVDKPSCCILNFLEML